jgi:membrane-associated phospholipid phosphatase
MASRPPARTDAERRFGARAVLAGASLALVAVPFSLLLFMVEAEWRPILDVDTGARDTLHELALDSDGFVTAMRTLSIMGSGPVYTVLFALLALWLAWRRLPRLALFVVVTMIGSAILNPVVKGLVDRARPVLEDPVAQAGGLSFPSGHAQSSVVATSVLLLVFLPVLRGPWRSVALAAAVAWALVIGFSRVALGVHYVSDVLAGWVLGLAWVALMTAAFSMWRRETGRPPVEPTRGLEPEEAARLRPGPPDEPFRRPDAAPEAPPR